ncbi:hypothetical protein KSP40_PGU022466 [Platanthera guangdongensis]|uniref:RRM domain-containing protein n=1 Tax=Platanthera guangdongensis TaxID=2320717 RepID=A0ABR2M5T9_9ASPA
MSKHGLTLKTFLEHGSHHQKKVDLGDRRHASPCNALCPVDYSGRLLTVNKAAPRGSPPERSPRDFEPSLRVYVGNLPWQVDDSRLEQLFSQQGKVLNARVVYDRDTGKSRGFGFVTLASKSELDDAIAALDGKTLDGRTIRVNVAEEKPRRGSF